MDTTLLRRLRERYTASSGTNSIVIEEMNSSTPNPIDWPSPPASQADPLACMNCRELLVELQLERDARAEDARAIDLLTVTLGWERAHGHRRGRTPNPLRKSDTALSMRSNVSSPTLTRDALEPSPLMEAYRALQERNSKAEDEWLEQRCRYEAEITQLKNALRSVEAELKNRTELSYLLVEEQQRGRSSSLL